MNNRFKCCCCCYRYYYKNCCCCCLDQSTPPSEQTILICGRIIGLENVSNLEVSHIINDEDTDIVYTNEYGEYCIEVPFGSNLKIIANEVEGYQVTPKDYQLENLKEARSDCDFIYNNIINEITVSGRVSGLDSVANIAIEYTINSIQNTIYTDENGFYSFQVTTNSQVIINPQTIIDCTVAPNQYNLARVVSDVNNCDFNYHKNKITLTRAVNTIPAYMEVPNTWPLHGEVLPNLYMTDKILISLPPSPVVTVKWEYGIRDKNYFINGGGNDITISYNNGLPVSINSEYTIYILLENGYQDVATITIDFVRDGTTTMPYLLIDFLTAENLKSEIPEIEQYTMYFMQGESAKLEKHYEVYEDIDMIDKDWQPLGIASPDYPYNVTEGFSGSLLGNNNFIKNFTIDDEESIEVVGLFAAAVDGAVIKDLSLSNCLINTNGQSAGFIGVSVLSNGGTVTLENLSVEGIINGFSAAGICCHSQIDNGSMLVNNCHSNITIDCITYGGGILGSNRIYENGILTVSNCTGAGYCFSVANDNAGIVAYCQFRNGEATITNCYSKMELEGSGRLGGIVGSMIGSGTKTIIINSCGNTGNISSKYTTAGITASLIGYGGLNFRVENCYNVGNLTFDLNPFTWNAAGIVGNCQGQCIVRNCYNTGNIILTSVYPQYAENLGGIIGKYNIVENCVSMSELLSNFRPEIARIAYEPAIGQVNSLSNNLAFAGMRVLIDNVPKSPLDDALNGLDGLSTTSNILTIQTTYEDELGWDFDNIWIFGNGDYQLPILKGIPADLQPIELPEHLR